MREYPPGAWDLQECENPNDWAQALNTLRTPAYQNVITSLRNYAVILDMLNTYLQLGPPESEAEPAPSRSSKRSSKRSAPVAAPAVTPAATTAPTTRGKNKGKTAAAPAAPQEQKEVEEEEKEAPLVPVYEIPVRNSCSICNSK